MSRALAILALGFVSACGSAGPPRQPAQLQRFTIASPPPYPIEPSTAPAATVSPSGDREARSTQAAERDEQLRTLEGLVRTARKPRDLVPIRDLLEGLAPELLRQRPPPIAVEEFEDWWNTVGRGGARVAYGSDRFVLLPEVPLIVDPTELRDLSPLLCPAQDQSCGTEARAFLLEAEARMATFSELRTAEGKLEADEPPGPAASYEERIAECERQALDGDNESAFSDWKACVEEIVPQTTRVPRNRFRMPERGVVITSQSGHWEACGDVTAYSLEAGLLLRRTSCDSSGGPRSRFQAARVDVLPVRRVALFAALLDSVNDSPAYAESFAIPPTIAVEQSYGITSIVRSVSDALEIQYEVAGLLPDPPSGWLYVHFELEPRRRLLAQLFATLGRSGTPTCVRRKDKGLVEGLLAAMREAPAFLSEMDVAVAMDEVRCN